MIKKLAFISAVAFSAAAAVATAQPVSKQESFNVQRTAYPGATQRNNDPEQCFLRAGCVWSDWTGWYCPNPKAYALCDVG